MDFLAPILEAIRSSETPTLFAFALAFLFLSIGWSIKQIRTSPKKTSEEKPELEKPPEAPDESKLINVLSVLVEELKSANGQNAVHLRSILDVNKNMVEALGGLKTGMIDTIVTATTHNIEDHDNASVDRFKSTIGEIKEVEKKVDALTTYIKETIFSAIEQAKTPTELTEVASVIDKVHTASINLKTQMEHAQGEKDNHEVPKPTETNTVGNPN